MHIGSYRAPRLASCFGVPKDAQGTAGLMVDRGSLWGLHTEDRAEQRLEKRITREQGGPELLTCALPGTPHQHVSMGALYELVC